MSKKRKKRSLFPLLLILILAVGFVGSYIYYSQSIKAVSETSEEVEFKVNSGDTSIDILQHLKNENLIKDVNIAKLYIRLYELNNFKSGTFTLNRNMDLHAILEKLNSATAAASNTVSVTVTEGDWAKHIAEKIAAVTNVSEDDLLKLWNDKEWITSLKSTYPFITDEMFQENVRIYLEGYIAPNTYEFYKETTANDVTMLDQTKVVYEANKEAIAKSKLSIHELYTLASIVQYEGGGDETTLRTIAGVFYNRLNQGMLLQSSVTVCYAIDFDRQTDKWQACEVNAEFDSPYNTYLHKGLPPGPIENPGEKVFKAVLNPIDTEYLYFVADTKTGEVFFAKTLSEHNQNVKDHVNLND